MSHRQPQRGTGRPGPAAAILAFLMVVALPPASAQELRTPGQGGVTRPQKLRDPLPRYPLGAQRDRLSGSVDLAYTVTAQGQVIDVEVLECTNPGHGFEESAQRAVAGWVYAPSMHKGRAVSVRMQVTVEFSPEEKLEAERWKQVEQGLSKLADAQIYPPGAHVAGRDGVTFPAAVKQPAPIYPTAARIRQITSRVILLVVVDDQGNVADVPLGRAQETAFTFREEAEKAVRRWRFQPATRDGQPVTAYHWIRLEIPPAETAPAPRRRR